MRLANKNVHLYILSCLICSLVFAGYAYFDSGYYCLPHSKLCILKVKEPPGSF